MNHKISEVTKLYDQLLDQQVSHHHWRPETQTLNAFPTRSDSLVHSAMRETPPNSQQIQIMHPHRATQPPAQVSNHLQMSPVQQTPSSVTGWSVMQGQPVTQPRLGQQHFPSSNLPAFTSPASQLSPKSAPVNIFPAQYTTQLSVPPQTVLQQQLLSKPPTASPPNPTFEQSLNPQPAMFPAVLPIVQSTPSSAYVPQTSVSLQQTAVPLFPTVPQTEPQISYGSRVTEPERREALLIDL
jgi:hypothetical protein